MDSQGSQLVLAVPGIIFDYAGSTAPTGFLFCDGSAVSRTTYARLFGVIGTAFGTGDGTSTFNLPDLRGRVAAGRDNMGGTAANRLTNAGVGNPGIDGAALGAAGGADRHALTTPQMPAHTHETGASQGIATGAVPAFVGGNFSTASLNTGSAGSGQAHPNAQPTIVLNKIIKF